MYKLNNLSIRTKIVANTSLLLLMLMLVSIYAWTQLSLVGKELEAIAKQDIPLTENITLITEHQLEQAIHFERAMRYGILQYAVMVDLDVDTISLLKAEISFFHKLSDQINEEIKLGQNLSLTFFQNAHSKAEAMEFKRVNHALTLIKKEHDDFELDVQQTFKLLMQGKIVDAEKMAEKIEHESDQLDEELKSLLMELEQFTEEAALRAETHEKNALNMITFLSVFSTIFGASFSWVLSSNIIKRSKKTVMSMNSIAEGDLTATIEIKGSDEFGQLESAMLVMQQRLLSMMSQITNTTCQLSETAEEVSTVMGVTSKNIQQQQVETEQVSTAMNEMSLAVKEVAYGVEGT